MDVVLEPGARMPQGAAAISHSFAFGGPNAVPLFTRLSDTPPCHDRGAEPAAYARR